jgi:amino acid transporter
LQYTQWTGFLEIAFLVIGAIVIVIKVGSHNTLAPFTLGPLHGALGPLLFGVIFSVLDFTGLGTATTISEEVRDSRRLVTRAIIIAWVLSGVALVLPSYALTVGWGLGAMKTYASSPDPGLIVFRHYLGNFGWILLILFTINSYLNYMVAKVNAVSRIWYAAGRDGLLFSRLKKVHPVFRTPYQTTIFFFVIITVIDIVAGLILGPTEAGIWLLTIAGVSIIAVHIVSNTALTVYMTKIKEFKWFTHGVIPSVATLMGVVIIWYSVYPVPKGPVGIAVLVAIAWLIAGAIVAIYINRRHGDRLRGAGASRED